MAPQTAPTYTPPANTMSKSGSHWSNSERARFEDAVRRYGPYAWPQITQAVGTRSEKQVKAFAGRNRQTLRGHAAVVASKQTHRTQHHATTSSSSTTHSSSSSTSASSARRHHTHHTQHHSTSAKPPQRSSTNFHSGRHTHHAHRNPQPPQRRAASDRGGEHHRAASSNAPAQRPDKGGKARRHTETERRALLGMGVMVDADDASFGTPGVLTQAAALVTDDFFGSRSRPSSEDGAPQDPLSLCM